MNVETTPELILAAAEKCPQAKEALKTLFPKVFEEKFKHPYGIESSPFYKAVIEIDDKVFFIIPPANNEWMNSVIDLCKKESSKRGTWIGSMIKGDNAYLGFRL